MKGSGNLRITLTALMLAFACGQSPVPIEYGRDSCDFCKMTIMDKRFAASLMNTKGKTLKFDSVECLAGFHESGQIKHQDIRLMLVADYETPGMMIDAVKAVYVQSPNLKSPMGLNAAAFISEQRAEDARRANDGEIIRWSELVKRATAR